MVMKKLIGLLVLLSVNVFATPYEHLLQQMRSDNSQYDYRFLQPPSTNSVLLFDTTTHLATWVDIATNFTYSSGTLGAGSGCQADWNAVTGCTQVLNKPTLGTSAALNVPASGNAASGEVVKGSDTRLAARSFNYATRSLNTCFQLSSTRDALVSYSVDISTTLSLTTGQTGTVYLRAYTNSSCSTGTQELVRFVNGNTGSLTIGLNITQNVTATLTGVVPGGMWVQLVTENTTGTPTFTARPGQEVLL